MLPINFSLNTSFIVSDCIDDTDRKLHLAPKAHHIMFDKKYLIIGQDFLSYQHIVDSYNKHRSCISLSKYDICPCRSTVFLLDFLLNFSGESKKF